MVVTVVQRFLSGALAALSITAAVATVGYLIHRHYDRVRAPTHALELRYKLPYLQPVADPPQASRQAPTAVLLVSANRGVAMYMLERIRKLFPGHFRNFVLLSTGTVDTGSFGSDAALRELQYVNRGTLEYLANYLHHDGIPARWYDEYGTDRIAQLNELCETARREYPNSVFFSSRLMFDREHWWNRWLHNQTSFTMQRRLHAVGAELIVLPVKL